MFQDCVFADVYAQAAKAKFQESIRNILAGREKASPEMGAAVFSALLTARILPDNSPRLTALDQKGCAKDLEHMKKLEDAKSEGAFMTLAKDLQAKGVDLGLDLSKPNEPSH